MSGAQISGAALGILQGNWENRSILSLPQHHTAADLPSQLGITSVHMARSSRSFQVLQVPGIFQGLFGRVTLTKHHHWGGGSLGHSQHVLQLLPAVASNTSTSSAEAAQVHEVRRRILPSKWCCGEYMPCLLAQWSRAKMNKECNDKGDNGGDKKTCPCPASEKIIPLDPRWFQNHQTSHPDLGTSGSPCQPDSKSPAQEVSFSKWRLTRLNCCFLKPSRHRNLRNQEEWRNSKACPGRDPAGRNGNGSNRNLWICLCHQCGHWTMSIYRCYMRWSAPSLQTLSEVATITIPWHLTSVDFPVVPPSKKLIHKPSISAPTRAPFEILNAGARPKSPNAGSSHQCRWKMAEAATRDPPKRLQ